jgi:hypothetical protein
VLFGVQLAQEIATALDGVQQVAKDRELLAGVFELANPAYSQLIGHRAVLGRPVREVLPEFAGQGIFELLDRPHGGRAPAPEPAALSGSALTNL